MGQSRKRYASLDYPLFPQRRRPWPWLLLAVMVLGAGVLAFLGWHRLFPGVARPAASSARPGAEQVVLVRSAVITPVATPAPDVIQVAGAKANEADQANIPLVASTPAATLLPAPVPIPIPTAAQADLVDEVDESEIPWSEQEGRDKILNYTVQDGDTLWSIASDFGLDVDSLRWSNPELERNPDRLSPGMDLVILPVTGIYYTVEAGDTLSDIAQSYGVSEADILNYPLNHLTNPDAIQEGQKLVIPHGRKELLRPKPQLSSDSPFAWPLAGTITQRFSDAHLAIDIGAPYASPVYAAREGRVIRSGWARTGYGYTVIIDHGDGLQSLYSHMKGEWVQVGDWVGRGQLIGEVGSTGNSSGPHVHFEVRINGERVNPLDYLPPGDPG
jgi:murein DD-endopeptidase MepM/ murein hydrolase activator NlpD